MPGIDRPCVERFSFSLVFWPPRSALVSCSSGGHPAVLQFDNTPEFPRRHRRSQSPSCSRDRRLDSCSAARDHGSIVGSADHTEPGAFPASDGRGHREPENHRPTLRSRHREATNHSATDGHGLSVQPAAPTTLAGAAWADPSATETTVQPTTTGQLLLQPRRRQSRRPRPRSRRPRPRSRRPPSRRPPSRRPRPPRRRPRPPSQQPPRRCRQRRPSRQRRPLPPPPRRCARARNANEQMALVAGGGPSTSLFKAQTRAAVSSRATERSKTSAVAHAYPSHDTRRPIRFRGVCPPTAAAASSRCNRPACTAPSRAPSRDGRRRVLRSYARLGSSRSRMRGSAGQASRSTARGT